MANGDVILARRDVFILPTRYGWMLALVLLVLLAAAINYGNGLAYALCFLLAALAIISMLYTHRNLFRLRLRASEPAAVFAGEQARFPLWLHNEGEADRYNITLAAAGQELARLDVPRADSLRTELTAPAAARGWLAAPSYSLATQFPLGLFYAWSRALTPAMRCLVYPAPADPGMPTPPAALAANPGVSSARSGSDDFAGLREFHAGDSPRHVAWRAVARGQGWQTKQFAAETADVRWIDWEELAEPDVERRLSLMCRALLDAEAEGALYGLRLPSLRYAPASGPVHRERCLRALALYPEQP